MNARQWKSADDFSTKNQKSDREFPVLSQVHGGRGRALPELMREVLCGKIRVCPCLEERVRNAG